MQRIIFPFITVLFVGTFVWGERRYRTLEAENVELRLRVERLTTQNNRLQEESRSLTEKIEAVEREVSQETKESLSLPRVEREGSEAVSVEAREDEEDRRARVAEMQTAAIGRLLSLTESEKDSLFEMYRAEQFADEPHVSLESILGAERANFIREEKRKAFSRSELEDVERDAYYFSRKLGLNEDQELEVLSALTDIQSQLREERKSVASLPMRERMQYMLREAKLYRQILMQRMQGILTQPQLAQYIQYDSESSAADMEMWHSPPDDSAENK
ncbi:MAG: hypothetical protein ACO3XO_10410 [Bdellovibrionota bacterium]